MELKKAYYYIICLASLFVLFWGVVDLSGSAVGLVVAKGPSISVDQPSALASEQTLDVYYQKKMLYDRLSDSIARIIVAGLIFGYSRLQVNKAEGK